MARMALLAITLLVALMGVYVADSALGLGLSWKLQLLRWRLFGQPMDGLGQRDPRLGWRPKANTSGTITRSEFTVTYTFGPDGYRITGPHPTGGPTVAIVGCSFTIGTGVNNDQAFPSVLQRDHWNDCQVRNLGVYGYGTAHALLQLQEEFQAGHKIDTVIYGWIAHHLTRNYLRRKWLLSLTTWGGQNPFFDLEDNKLIYKGLVGLDKALDEKDPTLGAKEWQITQALLIAMQKLCSEHQANLIVVLLPWCPNEEIAMINRQIAAICRSSGIQTLDLTVNKELTRTDQFYKFDGHPKPPWHRSVAQELAARIDPKGGRLRAPTSR